MTTQRAHQIHVITAGYLRRFAMRGDVMRHDVATGSVNRRSVRAVGWREEFWGPDPQFANEVEERLTSCEDRGVRVLRNLDNLWPLAGRERAELGQFIALHVVRTPAFGVFLRRVTEEAIDDGRDRERLAPREFAAAASLLRGHRMHADAILGQIARVAGLLCSTHWCLVRFDRDVLATSDHPVVIIPFGPYALSPASVIPESGLIDTVEVRFPVDPRTLLLMAWSDPGAPDSVAGTYRAACSSNSAVVAQALEEWFYLPGTTPSFLAPPSLDRDVSPIAPHLLPGYSIGAAAASARRKEADRLMRHITDNQMSRDQVRWVTSKPRR